MKTFQANLINSLTLILMPLWSYLTYEGTADKLSNQLQLLFPSSWELYYYYVPKELKIIVK